MKYRTLFFASLILIGTSQAAFALSNASTEKTWKQFEARLKKKIHKKRDELVSSRPDMVGFLLDVIGERNTIYLRVEWRGEDRSIFRTSFCYLTRNQYSPGNERMLTEEAIAQVDNRWKRALLAQAEKGFVFEAADRPSPWTQQQEDIARTFRAALMQRGALIEKRVQQKEPHFLYWWSDLNQDPEDQLITVSIITINENGWEVARAIAQIPLAQVNEATVSDMVDEALQIVLSTLEETPPIDRSDESDEIALTSPVPRTGLSFCPVSFYTANRGWVET